MHFALVFSHEPCIVKVELSLGTGIFIGCCMITGSLTAGFCTMLDTYILEALADVGELLVRLFLKKFVITLLSFQLLLYL